MTDSPWGYKESDMTELLTHTHRHTHTQTHTHTFWNLHIINQLYFNKKNFLKEKPTVGILMIKDNTLRIMQVACSCHLYSAL